MSFAVFVLMLLHIVFVFDLADHLLVNVKDLGAGDEKSFTSGEHDSQMLTSIDRHQENKEQGHQATKRGCHRAWTAVNIELDSSTVDIDTIQFVDKAIVLLMRFIVFIFLGTFTQKIL